MPLRMVCDWIEGAKAGGRTLGLKWCSGGRLGRKAEIQ